MGPGAPEFRPAARAEILTPFALIDGIHDEGRHAIERQQGPHGLIGVISFRVHGMPTGHQHTRKRQFEASLLGQEQQRGHEMLWLAFEDELLHPIPVALDCSGDPGIQRCPLGQAADCSQELFPQPLLVSGDLLRSLSLVVLLLPSLEGLIGLTKPVLAHHGARFVSRDSSGRHVQCLSGGGGTRQQRQEDCGTIALCLHGLCSELGWHLTRNQEWCLGCHHRSVKQQSTNVGIIA